MQVCDFLFQEMDLLIAKGQLMTYQIFIRTKQIDKIAKACILGRKRLNTV